MYGTKSKVSVTLTRNASTTVGPFTGMQGAAGFWLRIWQDVNAVHGAATGKITGIALVPPSVDGTAGNSNSLYSFGSLSGLTVQPQVTSKASVSGVVPNQPYLLWVPTVPSSNATLQLDGLTWGWSQLYLYITVDNTDASNNLQCWIEAWPLQRSTDPGATILPLWTS